MNDPDKVATCELGKDCRTPEGLLEWLLDKNDVSIEEELGLPYSELIDAGRNSNITNTYQFRAEITGKTTTMEFARKMESEVPYLNNRGDPQCICATKIDSCEGISVNTLDGWMHLHMITREMPGKGKHNEKGKETIRVDHSREIIGLI